MTTHNTPPRILLITNRDSDNLGDQVIEACDIALIRTAIDNLGLDSETLEIDSSALAIVSNKYCETDDKKLLSHVYKKINDCTLVLFGGAPVFNYAYQWFFKKTATILYIAKELGKPVLFSAVGIDAYDEKSNRCQLLKKELHNGSVVQITTRDGIEHLQDYAKASMSASVDSASGNTPDSTPYSGTDARADRRTPYGVTVTSADGSKLDFPIGLVSDPAVFTRTVFAPSLAAKTQDEEAVVNKKKKIGLFVFRAGGFTDSGISFDHNMQRYMWRNLCQELDSRGYDYELLTSGHFGDEAFLQDLIENGIVSSQKCVRNINTPELLLERINSYDGVITCRLHPSIISYAYGIPSVSLIWNSKVTDFYHHINYPERAISTTDIVSDEGVSGAQIVDKLERAMDEGVAKDNAYVESVYATLVDGLAKCLGIDEYSYQTLSGQELLDNMYVYGGTSLEMERDKVTRKFTRCYRTYLRNQNELRNLKHEAINTYEIVYHSGGHPTQIDTSKFDASTGHVEHLASHNIQYRYPMLMKNGSSNSIEGALGNVDEKAGSKNRFSSCGFVREGRTFLGWKARFRIGNQWYWCLENGGMIARTKGSIARAALFHAGDRIPKLPVIQVDIMVAEAVWQSDSFQMRYNSGRTTGECRVGYDDSTGNVEHLRSGSVEFSPNQATPNSGKERLLPNRFSYPNVAFAGWRLRVKEKDKWYWYCDDGSLVPKQSYDSHKNGRLRIFSDAATIPAFTEREVETVVAEAVWEPEESGVSKLLHRLKR